MFKQERARDIHKKNLYRIIIAYLLKLIVLSVIKFGRPYQFNSNRVGDQSEIF